MKKLLLSLLISLSFNVFGQDIGDTAWMLEQDDDGSKYIILFESDKTFTYISSYKGGGVWSDERDTWSINSNKLVVSFTDGYKIMSLTFNNNGKGVSGTSINLAGQVNNVTGKLIFRTDR